MFERSDDIARSRGGTLRGLARVAGGDPRTFYRSANFRGVDLRGQDLRGFDLSEANFEGALADWSTRASEPYAAALASATCLSSSRLLVVDDIPTNVRLLEARLRAEHFDVITATSGIEAIKLLASRIVHLVLLDIMMPDMDGYAVAERLKSIRNLKHIPLFAVTALDQPSDRERAARVGFDDFFTKPIDDVAFMEAIRDSVRMDVSGVDTRSGFGVGEYGRGAYGN